MSLTFRLQELGIELPPVATPAGSYVPATRTGAPTPTAGTPPPRTPPPAPRQEPASDLPPVAPPAGSYAPATRTGALIFTAGQLPFSGGELPRTAKVDGTASHHDGQE